MQCNHNRIKRLASNCTRKKKRGIDLSLREMKKFVLFSSYTKIQIISLNLNSEFFVFLGSMIIYRAQCFVYSLKV